MKMIFKPQTTCNTLTTNFSLLILRLSFGLSMAFAHGINKLPPSTGFISGLENHGFPLAILFAWLAGVSEFIGGLLIALGFLTRFSALSLMITMAIAIFIWHLGDPYSKIELAGAYFVASFVIFLMGSGTFSLDNLLKKYSR